MAGVDYKRQNKVHVLINPIMVIESTSKAAPVHVANTQGCGNTMPDSSDLVPFHSGQVENFFLLVLGQVQMYKYNSVFHILINYYELTSCIENSVDPNQLASSEAS